jgi:ATP-dependent Zn protease
MQEKVDAEIKKIIDSAHKNSLEVIRKERKKLDEVVKLLLKKETLSKEDFEKIVGKKESSSK